MRALLVSILVGNVLSGPVAAQPCASSSCQAFVPIEDGSGVVVHRSHDFESGSTVVRRLVLVVHGSGRNAGNVFGNIVAGAAALDRLDETLVIAPFFKTAEDAPAPADLYWSDGGWKRGDRSQDVQRISSFEVVDRILQAVIDSGRFPSLGNVTVTGHSAGGQFTQRYAVGSRLPGVYPELEFNYVVMNPSSYMYLNAYRPVVGDVGAFEIPDGCAGYDEYKYGLIDRNSYMSRYSAAEITAQYLERHVTYLVGSEDTSRTDNLDTSCAGDAQGTTRYERGLAYAAHIELFFPSNDHTGAVIAGVGHDSGDMASSAVGLAAIFVELGAGPPDLVPKPPTELRAE